MHADLRLAGSLPPLDAPHHMRATEWATYREGVVLSSVTGEGSLLNVGLDKVSHTYGCNHVLCAAAPELEPPSGVCSDRHCVDGCAAYYPWQGMMSTAWYSACSNFSRQQHKILRDDCAS